MSHIIVTTAFTQWKRASHYLPEKQLPAVKRALLALTKDQVARWAESVTPWEFEEFLLYCEVGQMENGALRPLTVAELELDLA